MAQLVTPFFRHLASRQVVVQSTGGVSESTASVGAQTYFLRLCAGGAVASVAGQVGVRYVLGTTPVANGSSAYLPVDVIEIIRCNPGERLAVLSNTAVAATLNIVELGT